MKLDNVKDISNKISNKNKISFLNNFFKKNVLKNFNLIKIGFIEITDGSDVFEVGNKNDALKCSISIESSEFYSFIGSGGILGATEAYAAGLWKCSDLVALTQIMVRNKKLMSNLDSGLAKLFVPINKFIHYRKRNTVLGSKKNILAHYDLGNDFYRLWLDDTMTYSCAYFDDEKTPLEDASRKKLDMVCKKLNLNKNDSVLEIGTGWGSFSIHAAQNYGCNITTTTISDKQYQFAVNRIKKLGLSDKITVVQKDYRLLNGKYDKIASIEMIEAVGQNYLDSYFKSIKNNLTIHGTAAIQAIVIDDKLYKRYKTKEDFIQKYIFPGGFLPSKNSLEELSTKNGLKLDLMNSYGEHYSDTLRIWRDEFLKKWDLISKQGFDLTFKKMWDFYLSYCEAGFKSKNIDLIQFSLQNK